MSEYVLLLMPIHGMVSKLGAGMGRRGFRCVSC